jgi:hypothetical protein
MRYVWAVCGIVLVLVWAVAPSRSDDAPTSPPPPATGEPITGDPSTPNPGDETVVKDPHTPYTAEDVGGESATWSRDQLTPEERAVADLGSNTEAWNDIHAGYRSAVLQQSAAVTAEVAARQLGVEHVGIGVVP